MLGTYQITIKRIPVDTEVIYFKPFVKGYYDGLPEDCYPDEPMEFEWKVNTGNQLLDNILMEDYYETIETRVRRKLERLRSGK